jgi:hypothetical protein
MSWMVFRLIRRGEGGGGCQRSKYKLRSGKGRVRKEHCIAWKVLFAFQRLQAVTG